MREFFFSAIAGSSNKRFDYIFKENRLGQILAYLLCSTVVVSGAWVALSGNPWPGSLLGTVGVAGIITAYLNRDKKGS